ncbi:MAG TPA: GYD domain-containing protein [Syntrophorhabdales bacterium]|nr:GYD domain-containing protein [Syntrophorhabdales bacterium]
MPLYIMFSTLTDEGRKTVTANPERIEEVNREIENMGAYVIAQYACLGQHDFINLIEAPDNEAIMWVSMELGSRGTVQIMTLPVIPIPQFIEKMVHADEPGAPESGSGTAERADK